MSGGVFEKWDVSVEPGARGLRLRCGLRNRGGEPWIPGRFSLGWQLIDPETAIFIAEGQWISPDSEVPPGGDARFDILIDLPRERGLYRVYVSPVRLPGGWDYHRGLAFLCLDAEVLEGRARLVRASVTTLGAMKRRRLLESAGKAFTWPAETLRRNRSLIGSMVRRDILARYRGSFGDAAWAVASPLLLMLTYYFVFGVVLRARFAGDPSRAGFVLYFLAGMLPWLAFSEPAGRAPSVIADHRNFVKKLVFPVEILPVVQVAAGLVTQAFALAVFLFLLLAARGGVPVSALWLPALLAPQVLFTLGACWFLAALGVFVRDLGHVIGFLLTLVFFLIPICYPETSLPAWALPVLSQNPLYVLVRGYRDIFLEARAPAFHSLWKLWLVAAAAAVAGHAWFHKLRRSFADVV